MKENLKMILVLTCITLLSGLILTATYEYTAPIIAEQEEAALARALEKVLGEVTDLEQEVFDEKEYFIGRKNGDKVVALVTSAGGYGGPVRVMVGVNVDTQEVMEINVVDHTETPGLGTVIEEERFVSRFRGLDFQDSFRDEVDTISGSTVSCVAVIRAVEEAVALVRLNVLGEDVEIPEDLTPEEMRQQFLAEFVGDEYEQYEKAGLTVYEGPEVIALEGSKEGYAGPVRTIIAVDLASTELIGIEVLEQQETPGLGDPITEDAFLDNFIGQSYNEDFRVVKEAPEAGEIEILSNATISTEAVVDLVNEAFALLRGEEIEVPEELTPDEERDAFISQFVGDEYEQYEEAGLTVYEGPEVIALEGSKEGWGGPVRTILAVDIASTELIGIKVLEQEETPGLGDPITEDAFLDNFIGQSYNEDFRVVKEAPEAGEIEILSNATISTEAVVDLVNAAFAVLRNMEAGGEF